MLNWASGCNYSAWKAGTRIYTHEWLRMKYTEIDHQFTFRPTSMNIIVREYFEESLKMSILPKFWIFCKRIQKVDFLKDE